MHDPQAALRLLTAFIAKIDALFAPLRRDEWHRPLGGLWRAQREYLEHGLEVFGGGDARERKRHQRLIDGLVERGVLLVRRRGKRRLFKLTDAAEDQVRRRAVGFGLRIAYDTLRYDFDDDRPTRTEWFLAGGRGWPRPGQTGEERRRETLEVVLVERRLAPALSRGLVRCGSDAEGRAFYTLAVPHDSLPTWPDAENLVELDDDLLRLYERTYDSERAALLSFEGTTEIGFIPSPVSVVTMMFARERQELESSGAST